MTLAPPPILSRPLAATDCHVHVFDPARFPYATERRYTPAPATVDGLLRMHAQLGIERTVLVQPSVYRTDNRCLVDALAQLGDRARGIAVVADDVSPQELADLWGAGVRGVRLNLQVEHHSDPALLIGRLERVVPAVQACGMVVQIHADTHTLLACAPTLRAIQAPVLIDHFGMVRASDGPGQHGMPGLLALLSCGHVWMKLSGPYQISTAPGYGDVPAIARAFVCAVPRRVVWGSDWPHTGGAHRSTKRDPREVEPFRVEDEQANLDVVIAGLSAPQQCALLADNPQQLFGFPHAPD